MENCNLCSKINITEKMQDTIKKQTGRREDHECTKFNKKVVHKNIPGDYIFPCDECEGQYFKNR